MGIVGVIKMKETYMDARAFVAVMIIIGIIIAIVGIEVDRLNKNIEKVSETFSDDNAYSGIYSKELIKMVQDSGYAGKMHCKVQGVEVPLDMILTNETANNKIHLNGENGSSVKLNNVECEIEYGKTSPGLENTHITVD
jgi:hypothetical protein